VLQLQRLICRRLDIAEADSDEEVIELSNVTAVGDLAVELEQRIPTEK